MKDLTIIGAGPIGMYATFYAALRSMSVNLIESMPNVGGQLTALYGDKYIYDLPGYAKIKAKDFISNLQNQIDEGAQDLVSTYLNQEIVEITKEADHFILVSNTKEVYKSKAILLTVGNGVFAPRMIGFDDELQYNNIVYGIKDISIFKDKSLTILGGGDSALDWALMLEESAASVNIIHRRDEYRAKEDSIDKLNKSNVNQYMSYLVEQLNGNGNTLESIVIKHKETNEEVTLKQDYLLVNYGNVTKVSDFNGLGVVKQAQGYDTTRTLSTNIEGLYACGNATNYEGKPKLITVGLGEVPVVINNIKGFIDPSSKNKLFYSSISK